MIITLNNIRSYAYHGVLPQENKVGDWYITNLRLVVSDERAIDSDCLDDTVNYAEAYAIVCEEMDKPSQLIEHVCGRIARRLLKEFAPKVTSVYVSVTKQNPPIPGADCDGCGVELELHQ